MSAPSIAEMVLNDVPLACYQWEPSIPSRGALLILHGMAEHSGRYAKVASFLQERGWSVFAHDHRGHGRTPSVQQGNLGQDGWKQSVSDIDGHKQLIQRSHPALPIFILGQGLGSYFLQDYLLEHSMDISGAILCGSNGSPTLPTKLLYWIAQIEKLRRGASEFSPLIENLTFSAWNADTPALDNKYDWLSHDPSIVQQYEADPLCGFPCSTSLWIDLIKATKRFSKAQNQCQISAALPLFILSGSLDPIGEYGLGTHRLLREYSRAGLQNLSYILYPQLKHEILWGKDTHQVHQDLYSWLEQHLS